MHFCIFNLSCYALLKANVYIFQSCTWLLTLFPTFSFLKTQNQEFQRVLLVVLLYCSIFKISFTVVFDSFYILSHLFAFVKPFFQIFSNSFLRFVFRLDVTFIYCITFIPVCQAFFQDFFNLLSSFSHGSRDSLFILPLSAPFVNRFEGGLYICIFNACQTAAFYSKIYIFRHYWGIKKSLRSFPADRRATALFNVPASKKAYI